MDTPFTLMVLALASIRATIAFPEHFHHEHQLLEDEHSHPSYAFKYGVKDLHTGDIKSQWEERDGDKVKGEYSMVEADGTLRTVTYTADDHNGFNAEVKKSGGPSHHPDVHSTGHSSSKPSSSLVYHPKTSTVAPFSPKPELVVVKKEYLRPHAEVHVFKEELLPSLPEFNYNEDIFRPKEIVSSKRHPLLQQQNSALLHSDSPSFSNFGGSNLLDFSSAVTEPWKPIVKPIIQKQEELAKKPEKAAIIPLSPTIRYVPGMALLMKHRMNMLQMTQQQPKQSSVRSNSGKNSVGGSNNGPVLFPQTPDDATPATERDGTPIDPTLRPASSQFRYSKKKFHLPYSPLNHYSRIFKSPTLVSRALPFYPFYSSVGGK